MLYMQILYCKTYYARGEVNEGKEGYNYFYKCMRDYNFSIPIYKKNKNNRTCFNRR